MYTPKRKRRFRSTCRVNYARKSQSCGCVDLCIETTPIALPSDQGGTKNINISGISDTYKSFCYALNTCTLYSNYPTTLGVYYTMTTSISLTPRMLLISTFTALCIVSKAMIHVTLHTSVSVGRNYASMDHSIDESHNTAPFLHDPKPLGEEAVTHSIMFDAKLGKCRIHQPQALFVVLPR